MRKPSQERSRVTVEAILEGASQVLRSEGLAACGTTKIAKRAGVSVGTLYQYFPNKESIFEELIDRLLDQRAAARSAVVEATEDTEDLGAAVRSLMDQLLAVHMADPELQHELHKYEATRGFTRLEKYEQQMQGVVAAALEKHAARLRPLNTPLAARVLVHAMTGVVERMSRENPRMLGEPAVRREIAALLAGYVSPTNPVALLDVE
ncbi:MAG: TetR/AcrR family transcriptional regulator [Deltaproteobacteria bacterium]|nr:TetR/AcrR family transcriptional regulator [Deltaproteobacteria bacterium]